MTDDRDNALPTENHTDKKGLMTASQDSLPSGYRSGETGGYPLNAPETDDGLDLRNIWRILNKRKWVIGACAAVFTLLGVLWIFLQQPLYTATIRMQIDRSAPKIVKGDDLESIDASGGIDTEIELLKSRNLAERVASLTHFARDANSSQFADLTAEASRRPGRSGSEKADREKEAANTILRNVVVKQVTNTRLVDISYSDPDPARAQKVAAAFGEAYIASNLDKRFQANSYAKSFLEDQLKQLKLRLEDSEKVMLAFAEKEQIVVTTDKASVAESNLAAANSALGAIIVERIKNEQLWRQAQNGSGIELPQILTNKAIEDLRSRRSQLTTEYQEKSETFRPDYPAMVQLNNKIKEIDHLIAFEVKTIKSSLKAAFDASLTQENEMKGRIEKLRRETLDLQKRSIQYNILKREVDTTRTIYESLLQRYKEVDVASGVGANNVFIVDKAQLPDAPSSPKKLLALFLALALGTAAGVTAAFVLEQFDDVVYSTVDAERASGLTLLGVIPKAGPGLDFEAESRNLRSAISEAFRSTCTSLQFSTEIGAPRTLTVTSAMASEGKTSTALGIGRQFAALGLKALVVDADLRKPSVHRKLDLDNSVGLSTYLTRNCESVNAIRQIGTANLYVMTSGPTPPNPVELLNGPRFASLLSASNEFFDLVIVDAPPIMGVAETLVICNLTSATLFVIAAAQGRLSPIRTALKRLSQARIRPLGLIFTKYDPKTASHGYGYGYGYGYGHEYGYGYGSDREAEPSDALEELSDESRKPADAPVVA